MRIEGLPDLRTRSANTRSPGVAPARASIRNSTASAAEIAASVCSCMRPRRLSGAASSSPAASMAGHPGKVVDQCEALADQAIEQRRLADVRPSDDGDREAHGQGQRVVDAALCPAAAMSAISASEADPARRPRRTTASIRAAASAAGQATGPGIAIAPGVALAPGAALAPAIALAPRMAEW